MKNLTLLIISVFLLSLFTAIAAPQPGLCYFGDSNGDCYITGVDIAQAKLSSLLKPADYSGITSYGLDSSVQDINGDGVVTISDYNLIKNLASLRTSGITGIPDKIMIVQAPSQLDIIGPTDTIKVKVTDADGTPRAGIGVLFTVDNSSIATLGGRDPSNGDNYISNSNSVFELTNKLANTPQDGEAQIAVTPLTIGIVTVNIVIPANPSKGLMNDITNSITINVVNGGGSIINTAPTEPVFTMVNGSTTSYSNRLIKFTVSSTDIDGNILTYSISGKPTGATFTGQTFEWTPAQSDKTSSMTNYNLIFSVTDGTATVSKGLTIILVNSIPVIQDISNITIDENGLVSVTPIATDDDNDALTVSYSSPLNSAGNWQTDYSSAGVYTITVTASDGVSAAQKTFNINVNDIQNKNDQGENSGGGGGGGHNYVNTAIPAVPAIPAESSAVPAVPAEPEQNVNTAEQNVNTENQGNQVTGFSVVELVKQNPVTTGIISVVILGLLGYGIYFFRK